MGSHSKESASEILMMQLQASLRNKDRQSRQERQEMLQLLKCINDKLSNNNKCMDTMGSRCASLASSYCSYSSQAERIKNTASKEDCMGEAIQQHITTIVETLPFLDSEVPDQIIQRGVATIDDAAKLRRLKTPDDQVSGLVSYVIKRDLKRMKTFLDIVKSHNSDVVENIKEMYELLIADNKVTIMPCVACELKRKCDIKWVYNYLFGRKLISTALHDRIVELQSPVGNQAKFWDELLREVTQHPPSCVLNVMVEALKEHGNDNVIDMLQRLIRKSKHLHCTCVCTCNRLAMGHGQQRRPSTTRRKSLNDSDMVNTLYSNTYPKEIISSEAIKNTGIVNDKRAAQNDTETNKESTPECHQISGRYETIWFGNETPSTSTGMLNTLASDTTPKEVIDNPENDITAAESNNAISRECTKDCDPASSDYETIWTVNQNSLASTDNQLMLNMDVTKDPDETTPKGRNTSGDTIPKRTGESDACRNFIRNKYDKEKMRRLSENGRAACNSDSETEPVPKRQV